MDNHADHIIGPGRRVEPLRHAGFAIAAVVFTGTILGSPGADASQEARRGGPTGAARAAGFVPDGLEPDELQATLAYLTVRDWVHDFDPPPFDDPAAAVDVDGATAVCVIVRIRGRVLGVGVDDEPGPLLLRRATGKALAAVLGDRTVAALPVELRTEIAERLTLQIEFAGRAIPLPGRSFDAIASQLDPGLDGVALRHGNTWLHHFPAESLQSNTAGDLARRLPGLAMQLGLPTDFAAITQAGARFYRFRTVHLTQRAPGRSPYRVHRASRVVPPGPLDDQSIATMAGDLVDHMIASLVGTPGLGLTGTYRPAADEYQPVVASPRDQAIAALSLLRFAALPEQPPGQTERLTDAARVILDDLQLELDGEESALADAGAAAAIVLAGLTLDPVPPILTEATRVLLDSVGPTGTVADADLDWTGPANQALAAAALSRLAVIDGTLRPIAQLAIARAWQGTEPHQQITLLPWIAWAEVDLARTGAGGESGRESGRQNLASLVRVLLAAQVVTDSTDPTAATESDRDLDGGFALGERPSAQSARPAAFLATDTAAELGVEPDQVRRAARFLLQLSVDDSDLWAFSNPSRALGGIRRAPWDCDMPIAAQAMTLIALTEAMRTLDIGPAV